MRMEMPPFLGTLLIREKRSRESDYARLLPPQARFVPDASDGLANTLFV